MPAFILNTAQQNRIRTVLWGLDRDCAEIERLIDADVDAGLVQIHNDLSVAERATLRAQIRTVRGQVQALAAALQLPPHVIDVRRHTLATLTIDWSAIVDSLPQKLCRYGEVNADASAFLQPPLEALLAALEAVLRHRIDECSM